MNWRDVVDIAARLPGVEEGASYGTPALKVKGKFFTRLKEDGDTLVLGGVGPDERDMLIQSAPETYFVTDHYLGWPYVLIRLSRAEPAAVAAFLERRWREIAPKRMVKAWEAEQPA